jgi:hypothetical protein
MPIFPVYICVSFSSGEKYKSVRDKRWLHVDFIGNLETSNRKGSK